MKIEVIGVLLSLFAGLSSCVGGLAVFCTSRLNPIVSSACLAFSAGVMLYVSLIELFSAGEKELTYVMKDASPGIPYLVTTAGFFSGWIISSLLDTCLHFMLGSNKHRRNSEDESDALVAQGLRKLIDEAFPILNSNNDQEEIDISHLDMEETLSSPEKTIIHVKSLEIDSLPDLNRQSSVNFFSRARKFFRTAFANLNTPDHDIASQLMEKVSTYQFMNDKKTHMQLSVFTAVALGLHNLPEGIATYSATIVNYKVGFFLAIAIAIHNIPEGIAVAVPIYHCTGSKFKGIFLAFISGMAEPIGALLAWGIIGSRRTVAVGITFAVVCGIMTNVSLKGLYPAALKYDPTDRVSSRFLVMGMAVMAVSFVAFALTAE